MDWRQRRYFVIRFYDGYQNELVPEFNKNSWVKVSPFNVPYKHYVTWTKWYSYVYADEAVTRGYYNIMLSCKSEYAKLMIKELEWHVERWHLVYREVVPKRYLHLSQR